MRHIVEQIKNKNYNDASQSIVEAIDTIMSKKLVEAKKIIMAEKCGCWDKETTDHSDFVRKKYKKTDSVDFMEPPSVDKAKRGLTMGEEDSIVSKAYDVAKNYVKNNAASTIAQNIIGKGIQAIPKIGSAAAGPVGIALDVATSAVPANAGEPDYVKQNVDKARKLASNDDTDEKDKKIAVNEKYGKGYVSPEQKIRSYLKSKGKEGVMDSSDKYRKEQERLDAEYAKLKAKDKKIDEEVEELDEARIKIVKARVRGGKVQRRKKVSNVPGMTLRGGRLTRMSPTERRHRKMGQRKGKIKRRAKLNRSLMKRARSLRKRQALGL